MTGQTVVILGATSAVAERYARLHAARGARLVLAGRDSRRLGSIATDLMARGAAGAEVAVMDLAAPAAGFDAAWADMAAKLGGRVDTALLAYGILGDQKAAEADTAEMARQLTTNMTSACAWLTVAANHLERQGQGTLIAIASVAGDRGRQSNYVYGAAKGGLALFAQGMAHRFAGTKVKVLTVKPGFIDTPMTDGLAKGGPLWATPEKVAADIDRAAAKGATTLYTPWFWMGIMMIIRNLPGAIFNRMKI
ncbi:SDR family oxidoreductase [Nitrospirillum viridazoti]|uniref:Short-chain dehydrogenase n=1 Tax=Nitrospirillum viridazoti CBAmc TaxID=1441467 RepID=A0A248K1U0_9PROT|nr:SDR family oxidoreductase [Nitrospirillum amazonense]ASG24902.1 short-chain dehydrogenase [Nitrospirillum amazonense CBAmc]TWB44942.1 short-subunit dehydrogenase [Nitrospirillum amazonense]